MSLIYKRSRAFFVKASLLFVAATFLQYGCVKKQGTEQKKGQIVNAQKKSAQGKLLTEDLEKKAKELAELRQETEALLSSLKEKEQTLNMRESHLDSLQADLQAREQALIQQTQNFKNMRSATLIMLFAVLVLLALAIVLLLKAKAAGQSKAVDAGLEKGVDKDGQAGQIETIDLQNAPAEDTSAAATAEKIEMEEKASDLIADIIDDEKKDADVKQKTKTAEVKPKRKRVSKSTATSAKKTTTTRRRTTTKTKPAGGTKKNTTEK